MYSLTVLVLFGYLTCIIHPLLAAVPPQIAHQSDTTTKDVKEKVIEININSDKKVEAKNKKVEPDAVANVTESTTRVAVTKKNEAGEKNEVLLNPPFNKPPEMESGALLRGVLVVVALCLIIIIYMAVKTYYRKRNKQQYVMVRKYGVRTRRSDIEMTPLPLDEDDDDETLFDMSRTNR